MNSTDFEAAVDDVLRSLPAWVRDAFTNVEILVLDEPTAEMDPHGEGLLGLYLGVPLPERGANDAGQLPGLIYIFRLPHLALGLDADGLKEEIRITVMHEIAHYFGIDDDHLHEIGMG